MGVQGPTGVMVSVNVAQRTDFTVWTDWFLWYGQLQGWKNPHKQLKKCKWFDASSGKQKLGEPKFLCCVGRVECKSFSQM